jgi:CBS domain-containing protein
VVVARATESLRTAAQLMQAHRVGSVVVCEDRAGMRAPVGIVTDRDIVMAVLKHGVELDALLIGQAMSRAPVVLLEDDGVDDAVERMRAHAVRRAPVVSREGALVGIVTIDDLVDALVTTLSRIARLIQKQTAPSSPHVQLATGLGDIRSTI